MHCPAGVVVLVVDVEVVDDDVVVLELEVVDELDVVDDVGVHVDVLLASFTTASEMASWPPKASIWVIDAL